MAAVHFQSGIGGSLWFSLAIVIDILLFPALSLQLKTRAPGAKTFPQVQKALYSKVYHLLLLMLFYVVVNFDKF